MWQTITSAVKSKFMSHYLMINASVKQKAESTSCKIMFYLYCLK